MKAPAVEIVAGKKLAAVSRRTPKRLIEDQKMRTCAIYGANSDLAQRINAENANKGGIVAANPLAA